MRVLLLVAVLALLGACNVVITKTPLFVRADATRGPGMRPGVWLDGPDAGCALDDRLPLAAWPECADGFVILDDGAIGGYEQKDGMRAWTITDAIVAAGDPLIFQIHLTDDAGAVAKSPDGYFYAGLEATRRDDTGRALATVSWPVLCGPPPPASAKTADGKRRAGTLAPFPGLIMDAQGNDCTTNSPDALRAAAQASRKIVPAEQLSAMHWVRDGDR